MPSKRWYVLQPDAAGENAGDFLGIQMSEYGLEALIGLTQSELVSRRSTTPLRRAQVAVDAALRIHVASYNVIERVEPECGSRGSARETNLCVCAAAQQKAVEVPIGLY